MASVTFQSVTKRFGDVTAVDRLDLEIADKEFLVLVGPSGCGKSTTLRMLAGLEEATEGEIMIGDRVVNELPPRDRDIAMVFQSYALYPHKSVYENLAFGLRNRRVPKADIHRRVQGVAELLEITDLLQRPPRHLSGGQRQRVALGRAIVREPAVFLMDEPLSNLDAQLRVTMRAELIKLHAQLATTIVYVTHDQVEALTMGTRIAVLRDGILEQIGTADDLYGAPKNRFVAGFIGSPAMNFVPGRIEVRDGVPGFAVGGQSLPVHAVPQAALGAAANSLLLGIRPEHCALRRDGEDASRTDPLVDIVFVEPMGGEALIGLDLEGNQIAARVDTRQKFRTGERVNLAIDSEQVHLFDPDTGNAIR
ncbi:MAG: sn-glycerol-3-phosphate ABC transporter ATP-binding protein UgpC [Rhodospirillales bacterium]|nr:sn-glycerol-3-phosphate ABC transporter ATP-binding protein UgpC [Rhodospirillales bacterium]MDE0378341.1 sn-glycerol-3-phosphate ABC transporter ATP-binding protein UgpC [Rhodospirillales bacterium]